LLHQAPTKPHEGQKQDETSMGNHAQKVGIMSDLGIVDMDLPLVSETQNHWDVYLGVKM
jgi:hypothetical protein